MPMRIPSTTSRAISSREPMRWRVSGSRYFRRGGALPAIVEPLIGWYRLQEFRHNVVGAESFGAGGKVGDDAVAQDRPGHGLDVLDGNVEAAAQHRPCLARHNQEQAGPRPGPVRQPVPDESWRARIARPGRPHQLGGILENMVR